MKQIIFLILMITFFATSSCRKSFNLPAATTTGANTFGCILNGIKYKASGKWPKGVGMIYPDNGIKVYTAGNNLVLVAYVQDSNGGKKTIELEFIRSGVNYITDFLINGAKILPNSGSYIKITRNDNVLSGTFEAHIQFDVNKWDIVDGRFDISLN